MSNERINLFSDFTLDLARGCLVRNGEPIHLRPQTYEVLKYLVLNSGRLISKDRLIEEVWQGRAVTDGSLGKCIEEVREAFGADARRYVRNVRGRGYIFDPETAENGSSSSIHSEEVEFLSVVVEDEVDEEAPLKTTRGTKATEQKIAGLASRLTTDNPRRKVLEVVLLVLPLLAVPMYLYATRHWYAVSPIESIAVMPFVNESGNADLEYLSDGLTESLISQFARLPRLSVKSRAAVFRYKGRNVEPQQVASELSVQAILNGRLVQHGEAVGVYLSLVDGRTGNQIWGEQYNRKVTDVVTLQTELAQDVSDKLRLRLTSTEKQELTKGITQNNDAYQAYLKGRYYWSRPSGFGFGKSLDYFQQAIDLDPNYATAYTGLAHYYGFAAASGQLPPDENWPKSESLLSKAMALDDSLAESYNALAGIQLYYHRDWPAAERSFRRGLEMNANSAEVHHHYGRCLSLFGRNEEATSELQRAIQLEPLSTRYQLNLGILFFFIRQYDRAIDQIHKTLELDPNFTPAHDWLGYAYEKKGMQREAIAEWSRMLVLIRQNERATQLEHNYSTSGYDFAVRSLAQQNLKELNDKLKRGEYVPAIEYVNAYTRLNNKDMAFESLAKALQERNRFSFEVKTNPLYDTLRDDPRFEALLRRFGFSS